jgi:putative transposase
MPRASEYLVEGYTYHLTHRCHDRKFLLRFGRDRDLYREWLREGVKRYKVPVYGFCITRNHVHIVLHATDREAVGELMRLASGSTAKHYNIRKDREGSMWEHPYQCTAVEDGQHLRNCLRYIDLNMVRAGEVLHPREWRWCGYDELTGTRQRYRLLNTEDLLRRLEIASPRDLWDWYRGTIDGQLAAGGLTREAHWTESLAVGSQRFVEAVGCRYPSRQHFVFGEIPSGTGSTWTVRERATSYAADSGTKTSPKSPERAHSGH